MSPSPSQQRQLHLNVVIRGSGHHAGAWKHPQARPQDELSLDYYAGLGPVNTTAQAALPRKISPG